MASAVPDSLDGRRAGADLKPTDLRGACVRRRRVSEPPRPDCR
jgi:hypothetical protein